MFSWSHSFSSLWRQIYLVVTPRQTSWSKMRKASVDLSQTRAHRTCSSPRRVTSPISNWPPTWAATHAKQMWPNQQWLCCCLGFRVACQYHFTVWSTCRSRLRVGPSAHLERRNPLGHGAMVLRPKRSPLGTETLHSGDVWIPPYLYCMILCAWYASIGSCGLL